MPRILLGEALRQNERCAEAVPEYRAAIAIRPQDEFPYTRLAGCLLQGQRLDEAEGTLQQLRTVNPTSQDAAMGLGVFAILHGRLDESRAHFQDVLARDPGRERAKLMLGFVEGTLPEVEKRRLCAELQTVAGGTLTIDQCRTNAQRGASDPAVASHN
jgi:Flp pilus assembly protein TadD